VRTLLVAAVIGLVATVAAPHGPRASFKVTPKAPAVGQLVKLNASKSRCKKKCRYQWRVIRKGKARKLGKKSSGKVLRYRFKSAGVKRIRLTIRDGRGRKARRTKKVTVKKAGAPGTGAPGFAPGTGAPGTGTPGIPGSPPPPPPPTTKGCFPDPSRCGYPDADNTGPAVGLTPVQSASLPSGAQWDGGTLRINADNVTVQNLDIPGAVAVGGDNVTIRNSRIAVDNGCSSPCGSYGIRLGEDGNTVSGTVLSNLDIVTAGGAKVDHGVRNNGDEVVTADRLYVKGFAGAWKGPGTITNSYLFSDLIFAGDHVEAYLNGGEGDPSILVHNTILNPIDQTAAISFFDDFGDIGQVIVQDNLMAGGGYVMYGGAKNSASSVKGPMLVRANRIARGRQDAQGYFPNGGYYGLWAEFNPNVTTACDNYWDDNLAPARNPDSDTRC
jgi:hypothetical protein